MPKLNTIGVTSDLDGLISSIKEKEEAKQQSLPDFDASALEEDWNTFRSKISAKSVIAAFKHVEFTSDGNSIQVFVPTERIKEVLLDSNYFVDISARFKQENISHQISIDKERFPDYDDGGNQVKPKTDMEKYQEMVKKNPALEQLRKKLDLEFDQ